jgi:hypothetical protein
MIMHGIRTQGFRSTLVINYSVNNDLTHIAGIPVLNF